MRPRRTSLEPWFRHQLDVIDRVLVATEVTAGGAVRFDPLGTRWAAAASEDGRLPTEIIPLGGLDRDSTIRPTTSMEALSRLPTVFDSSAAGTLTAGNARPLTDGAAVVVLMSQEEAETTDREPLAFIKGTEFAAISPDDGLLMGPGVTVPRLLGRLGMELDDIDLIEMHEAFGGQVAANLAAWEHGWKHDRIGKVDRDSLNVTGGSISIGHPFAATGAL
jgi:acetyl-CoA acyltransferase